jgi:hypothetical protein
VTTAAVPHVAGAAEHGSHEVLQIAAHVQREVPGRVGDARGGPEQALVVREELDLARERLKLANQQPANIFDHVAILRGNSGSGQGRSAKRPAIGWARPQ